MRWGGYILVVIFLPFVAQAHVRITEIMYAPEGADSDREWVEVCAESEVDISSWKLYENDTNHGLSIIAGSAVLAANECAIIADDAAVFATEYASYTGSLFDSAFSLSNTGETLTLRDAEGTDIDTSTYNAAMGAKDDGQTLHRSDTAFTAGTPTPGTTDSTAEVSESTQTENSNVVITTQTQTVYEYLSVEPPQDVHVRVEGDTTVAAHSNSVFRAEVYNARGIAEEHTHVTWNFGDGTTGTGSEVSHRYWYPGTYTLAVFAKKEGLSAQYTDTVTVFEPLLAVALLPNKEGVRVTNSAAHAVTIAGWRITAGGSYFIFPADTRIEAENSVVFSKEVLNSATLAGAAQVQLYTPRGTLFAEGGIEALQAEELLPEIEVVTAVQEDEAEESIFESQKVVVEHTAVPVATIIGKAAPRAVSPAVRVSTEAPAAARRIQDDLSTVATSYEETQVASVSVSVLPNGYEWYMALAALMVVGVGGIVATRRTAADADTYTIVE